jgi:hypothetical protein
MASAETSEALTPISVHGLHRVRGHRRVSGGAALALAPVGGTSAKPRAARRTLARESGMA